MNEKQIAFITCVNDGAEYEECRYYLSMLNVPDGYSTDLISVQEAPSMAAGYNAAMKSSDAKYKVYLHQDTFIKNRNFIPDLLSVFAADKQIGMLGMVGNRIMWKDMTELMLWDTGKVTDSFNEYPFRFPEKEDVFLEVRTADGLLLATQYDLLWREDLFDGWHFYDLAQCMEFRKAGYKVAVPWQETSWCYHDNSYLKLGSYYDYYELFAQEYGDRIDFPVENQNMNWPSYTQNKKFSQAQMEFQKYVEKLLDRGERITLCEWFEDPVKRELRCIWDHEIVVRTDYQEEENQSILRFWNPGMSASQLIMKIKALKHALKRIEYGFDTDGQEKKWIVANYSKYAVRNVCSRYAIGSSESNNT